MKVLAHVKAFLKDEEGASGIEYALIAVMVAVIIAPFAVSTDPTSIGAKIKAIFTAIQSKLVVPT